MQVKEQAASRKAKLEAGQQLSTRAFKDAQAATRVGKPTSATIRVRLPDGIILQVSSLGDAKSSLGDTLRASLGDAERLAG